MDVEKLNITAECLYMKIKYVTYGNGYGGPAMFVVIKMKTISRGYEVSVYPCDIEGNVVSDAVFWRDNLGWWDATKMFYQQYQEYKKYVNDRR